MEIMESIKRVNKTQAVKKCAAETKKVINTLLTELTNYTELQAELWDRGWYEVKQISHIDGCPSIEADMILEDDLESDKNNVGRVKRITYNVKIRMDAADNFEYDVEMVDAEEYFHKGCLIMTCIKTDGLN